ncbi:hypothetical protein [uncultured Bifidobacterium sp.]|uniref:hypothetical protein n=1 Tax=uncultured Bifidobacterium sp. TaxID=165187 RepID=UPI00260889E0|nr:hypothetical protein [uncultured Bifidobacterium sp.]
MNDSFRMRLYALTCVTCIAWLAQSVSSDFKDGTLATAPSIILIVCIAVAVLYTGISAAQLWITQGKSRDDKDDDGNTDDAAK